MGVSASKTFENFPFECIEDIFRHLNSEDDLLECTLVCPSWNEYIGSSRWCMQKIIIRCPEKARLKNLKNDLLKSKRKYFSIYVHGDYSNKMRKILSTKGTWTHIFSTLSFVNVADFFGFLRVIAASIQKLTLYGEIVEKVFNPDIKSLDLKFPNLRHLCIETDFSTFYDKAFLHCKSLTSLSTKLHGPIPHSALNAIRTSWKSNIGLKRLHVHYGSVFNVDFLPKMDFKLTEFEAFALSFNGPYSLQVFKKFLMTQKDNLEVLNINGWEPIVAVIRTILTMSRLKNLYLTVSQEFHLLELNPRDEYSSKNLSTSSLYLRGFYLSINTLKIILNVFPNVQSLVLNKLDDENADEIAKACKSLRFLTVNEFEAENISNEEFYLNLEVLYCCNDNFKFLRLDMKRWLKRLIKIWIRQMQQPRMVFAIIVSLIAIALLFANFYKKV